jgi:hypothetical protein
VHAEALALSDQIPESGRRHLAYELDTSEQVAASKR